MLTVEVQRSGGETAMGDIVRLVEEAQSREAPVQRLADKVPLLLLLILFSCLFLLVKIQGWIRLTASSYVTLTMDFLAVW